MKQKIVFMLNDKARDELVDRSQRMIPTGPPLRLIGVDRSIQFLRGVFSRSSLCLPAFYYFLGAASAHEDAKSSKDFPFKVAQSYSEFSDLNTITLSCRKLFDHSTKPDLTGANFSKTTDDVLIQHAEYWSKKSARTAEQALTALKFLRQVFAKCSKTHTDLLQESTQLQRRIGILKQHADRAAAHLSLENYAVTIQDLVHFVGAGAIIGEIIRSFDNPSLTGSYFAQVDAASYQVAKRVFPQIAKFQLFAKMNIEMQARLYWECAGDDGIQMLLNELQYALGGDPTGND